MFINVYNFVFYIESFVPEVNGKFSYQCFLLSSADKMISYAVRNMFLDKTTMYEAFNTFILHVLNAYALTLKYSLNRSHVVRHCCTSL